jgi:hypothetical protein
MSYRLMVDHVLLGGQYDFLIVSPEARSLE